MANEERPPYIEFERRSVENRNETIKQGKYVGRDVDFVVVTPVGSKDRIPYEVDQWLANQRRAAAEDRLNPGWLAMYEAKYEAFKNQQTIPENGTPIRGWPVLSPSQQEEVLRANVRTVEDLAVANENAIMLIGMGARSYKQKAIDWLASAQTGGKPTELITSLRAQLGQKDVQIETLNQKVRDLTAKVAELEERLQVPA